jgi:uncharacterized protein YecT (DUF1311 family)
MRHPIAWLLILMCATSGSASAQAALRQPALPVRAAPNSLASFPCPRKPISTLAIEACAARRLLRIDREFNKQAGVLWSVLDAPSRRAFLRAHRAWLTHRDQWCEVAARRYLGGTAASVEAGQCQIDVTTAWVKDVRLMVAFYCRGVVKADRFRQCPRS